MLLCLNRLWWNQCRASPAFLSNLCLYKFDSEQLEQTLLVLWILQRYYSTRVIQDQVKKKAPRWLLKFLSPFDREASGMLALVGIHISANNSRTRKVFDWTPISFERSVIDSARAVQKLMDGGNGFE